MPIIVVTSRDNVQTHVLEEGVPLFLGRSEDCDIVLPSAGVSRRHAVILYKDGLCGVKDLGSFNGTSVNGEIIQEPLQLTDEDILRISSYVIRLHTKDQEQADEEDRADAAENDAAIALSNKVGPRQLRLDSHKFEGSSLPLPRAMRLQQEVSLNMGRFQSVEPDSRDTQRFYPDRDTVRLGKADGNNSKAGDSEPTDDVLEAGYFTPFSVSETVEAGVAPNPESMFGAEVLDADLTEFEESPLAPLENITQFDEDDKPVPFLMSVENMAEFVTPFTDNGEAVIPLESDSVNTDAGLSSKAEAIIPLLDDTPFVSTLAGVGVAQDGEDSDETYEHVPSSSDTAVYTLSAGIEDVDNSGDVQEEIATVTPDEEEPALSNGDTSGTAILERAIEGVSKRVAGTSGRFASSQTSIRKRDTTRVKFKGKSSLLGIDSIPISPELMAAINDRLALYSRLNDLVEERKQFRLSHPDLSEEVEEEFKRQDSELDDLPTTEETERQLSFLRDRKEQFAEAIRQARDLSLPDPAKPTPDMVFAEELAVKQWRLIGESNRKALPPIYREAYSLAANEPLAQELHAAGISHGRLFGGAMYLLALEALAAIANQKRFRIAGALADTVDGTSDESGGSTETSGEPGKKSGTPTKLSQIRRQRAQLKSEEHINAIRVELASREARFIEKVMSREFHSVYKKAALSFVPDYESMPVSVRAFLRHGVVGFAPWWMTKEVRDFILKDSSDNISTDRSCSLRTTNVLYADEYLFAVSTMECTPSPDEELQRCSPSSIEWRTDRAYRRIVNARTYNVLMEEMLSLQEATRTYLGGEVENLENQIASVKRKTFLRDKEELYELQRKHEQLRNRYRNSSNNMERIHDELIPSILDAMEDAERHFRTGDLRIPDQETLINREVDALFRISRRLEGTRERFVPMAVREHYRARVEKVNERKTVRAALARMEELDPGIFVRTIIPAKSIRTRVDLRMGPTVILFPSAGENCLCSMGREGMERGHLVMPTCFVKTHLRSRQMTYMFADFRWETSRAMAGRNVYSSDTMVGVIARMRRDAMEQSEAANEKRLIFLNMSGKENWRRIYELYLPNALNAGRALFQYNTELYEELIGKYIDPLEGVKILRRAWTDPDAGK